MQQTLIFPELPTVKIKKPAFGKGSGKPRGRYKPRTIKPKTYSEYQELQDLQFQIALLINPGVLFKQSDEELTEYQYFNFWVTKYNEKEYEYRGEKFKGEKFNIISAELKGCENLGIKEKLFIHRKFFINYKTLNTTEKAAQILQPLILSFGEGKYIFSDIKPRFEYGDIIKTMDGRLFCLGQTQDKKFVFKKESDGKEIVLDIEQAKELTNAKRR